jgi:predicted metal-dependent enzyme (double-stranded beta helix superfamily)
MSSERLPAFQTLIDDLRVAFTTEPDKAAAMRETGRALERALRDDSLRDHCRNWPSTEGHKNLLLYEDPDHGFVINAVVRTENRKRGIHDHAHAWTAYGILDGTEELARYRRLDDGAKDGYAEIELVSMTTGRRGTVDVVPPFGIHSENGGCERSVAIIVRSERLVGKCLQGRYKPDTKTTYQGEGPTQVPFAVTA